MNGFGQLLLVILVTTNVALLAAQDKTEKNVFRVLGYGDGFFQDIFFEREGFEGEIETVVLGFAPDRRSKPYQIPIDTDSVVFYREQDTGQDSKSRIEVGRVEWAPGASVATLLFLELSEFAENKEYRILFIDESPEQWGGGDFRFLNLAGSELDLRLGDETFDLQQGLPQTYTVSGKTTEPIRLSLFVDWEGERHMVYSIRTAPDPRFGKFMVIKPPTDPESLRIRVITIW